MRRAMAVTNILRIGPMSIADTPVPAGWEHVPTKGTGTGMQEITNINAPINPKSGLSSGFVRHLFLMMEMPKMIKGRETKYQSAAHLRGRIPSEICMAKAGLGLKQKMASAMGIILLQYLFMGLALAAPPLHVIGVPGLDWQSKTIVLPFI